MTAVSKKSNPYADLIDPVLYAQTPKAVLAAIVVSLLSGGGDDPRYLNERIRAEWQALYDNGIVPQKPK